MPGVTKPLSSGAWVAVLCGSLAALGCKENPDEPEFHEPCTGAVTVSVDLSEQQPRFRWTPACLVATVVVESAPRTGNPSEHWRVAATRTIIAPPILYGRLPVGADSPGFLPLMSNQDYRVTVYVLDRVVAVGVGSWHQP